MAFELILNDLSCKLVADIPSAKVLMSDLVKTLLALRHEGSSKSLRTHSNINFLDIAPDYNIPKWRNDPSVDRDERSFLRSLTSKSPYLSDLPDLQSKSNGIECHHQTTISEGLGATWLLDGISVSLRTSLEWDQVTLEIEVRELCDDSSICVHADKVRNVSTVDHIGSHLSWIQNCVRDQINSGKALKEKKGLFTNLEFCDNSFLNIEDFQSNEPKLKQVIKKLWELDAWAQTWSDVVALSGIGFKVTPESESTMAQYSAERTFLCPDGEQRQFELHFRITPGPWRCHIFPDSKRSKIIVGYIGPHLPTTSDP